MSFTVTFIGHSDCYGLSYEHLYLSIQNLIQDGAVCFLSGGLGTFDHMAARAVYHLKSIYPQIQNQLIIPYPSFRIHERKYFDEIIWPDSLEMCPYKAAIPKRNRYMVDHSNYAICYITHNWGGAAKTYHYAVSKGLHMINLSSDKFIQPV